MTTLSRNDFLDTVRRAFQLDESVEVETPYEGVFSASIHLEGVIVIFTYAPARLEWDVTVHVDGTALDLDELIRHNVLTVDVARPKVPLYRVYQECDTDSIETLFRYYAKVIRSQLPRLLSEHQQLLEEVRRSHERVLADQFNKEVEQKAEERFHASDWSGYLREIGRYKGPLSPLNLARKAYCEKQSAEA